MAQSIASGSSSNGLGYSSKREIATEELVVEKSGGKAGGKGEDELEIRIEFGGGLHLLFSQQPRHTVHLPRHTPSPAASSDPSPEPTASEAADNHPATMRDLIRHMKRTILSEREEMFGEGDGVRPGILVLINDADWELEGELEYELKDRDEVVFISTLHGG